MPIDQFDAWVRSTLGLEPAATTDASATTATS
jgi:hypothetical protein